MLLVSGEKIRGARRAPASKQCQWVICHKLPHYPKGNAISAQGNALTFIYISTKCPEEQSAANHGCRKAELVERCPMLASSPEEQPPGSHHRYRVEKKSPDNQHGNPCNPRNPCSNQCQSHNSNKSPATTHRQQPAHQCRNGHQHGNPCNPRNPCSNKCYSHKSCISQVTHDYRRLNGIPNMIPQPSYGFR